MVDQLTLGTITFQNYDYAPPNRMPFGGQQAMIVHKLPGGNRVIDTLGPDEDDISWSGFFLSPNALFWCRRLDGLRAQGLVQTLTFAGTSRQVIIKSFRAHIRRYPNWVEYEIDCTVSTNPTLGQLSGGATQPGVVTGSGGLQGPGVGLGLVSGSPGGGGTAAGAGTGAGTGTGSGTAGGGLSGGGSISTAGLTTFDQLILADLAAAMRAALVPTP